MERDFGYRRVQLTGRGSYIVSLPKEWAKEAGIGKGSELAFKLQDDLSMLLVPRRIVEGRAGTEEPITKEYFVNVDMDDDTRALCRKIISLYAVSSGLIHVRFKNGSAKEPRKAVKNLVKNTLLGSEIVDETDNEITIKTMIELHQFPVDQAIRRMAILALSAINGAASALMSADKDLLQDVFDARRDVSRLCLYVVRQLKFGLEHNLFEELGFRTPKEFLGYRIVANDVKSIADNAMNIARNIMVFKKMIEDQTLFLKEPIDEEVYSQILDFNSLAQRLFEDSLAALFKRDYEQADKTISEIESRAITEDDLIAVISSKKLDPNVSSIFSLILDSAMRIIEYSRNIAEVTLNRTIEEVSAESL